MPRRASILLVSAVVYAHLAVSFHFLLNHQQDGSTEFFFVWFFALWFMDPEHTLSLWLSDLTTIALSNAAVSLTLVVTTDHGGCQCCASWTRRVVGLSCCGFVVGLLWICCGFVVCLLCVCCGFVVDLLWVC